MKKYSLVKFDEVNPSDFMPLLNGKKTKKHLIDHKPFTHESVTSWINTKKDMDVTPGCRVRAIVVADSLAGWCAIQMEGSEYEMAVVIHEKYWGMGKKIFQEVMAWAKELEHKMILIHFLHTRPRYKFLEKMAIAVYETRVYGEIFTSYKLAVD